MRQLRLYTSIIMLLLLFLPSALAPSTTVHHSSANADTPDYVIEFTQNNAMINTGYWSLESTTNMLSTHGFRVAHNSTITRGFLWVKNNLTSYCVEKYNIKVNGVPKMYTKLIYVSFPPKGLRFNYTSNQLPVNVTVGDYITIFSNQTNPSLSSNQTNPSLPCVCAFGEDCGNDGIFKINLRRRDYP